MKKLILASAATLLLASSAFAEFGKNSLEQLCEKKLKEIGVVNLKDPALTDALQFCSKAKSINLVSSDSLYSDGKEPDLKVLNINMVYSNFEHITADITFNSKTKEGMSRYTFVYNAPKKLGLKEMKKYKDNPKEYELLFETNEYATFKRKGYTTRESYMYNENTESINIITTKLYGINDQKNQKKQSK